MTADNLMPIGRFSRSCRLTVKAVRHYGEVGLLEPAWVDPSSGYRYYARSQARDAILIGMLRSLGVGIPAIRGILDGDDAGRIDLLEREIARREREIERQREALRSLRRVVAERDLFPYCVAIRAEAPLLVAQRHVTTTSERLIPDTTELVYALFDELRAAGQSEMTRVLCINDAADAEDRVTVFACVAVSSPPPVLEQARVVELPGGEFAWVTHEGSYGELGLAYHALYAWVQEHGHEEAGLVREIYFNDPRDVAPRALLTELLLPIR